MKPRDTKTAMMVVMMRPSSTQQRGCAVVCSFLCLLGEHCVEKSWIGRATCLSLLLVHLRVPDSDASAVRWSNLASVMAWLFKLLDGGRDALCNAVEADLATILELPEISGVCICCAARSSIEGSLETAS